MARYRAVKIQPQWVVTPGKQTNITTITLIYIINISMLHRMYSDSLRVEQSGDRIPLRSKFSSPVQTGPGAHQASYIRGTVSLPEVKRPGRGVSHPRTFNADVKQKSGPVPSWQLMG
jgi:hypothetical protein